MAQSMTMKANVNNGHVIIFILIAIVFSIVQIKAMNCSLGSFACLFYETSDRICLSPEKTVDRNIDCIGHVDEPRTSAFFACRNNTKISCPSTSILCNNYTECLAGDDEKFCHHLENANMFQKNGICQNEDTSNGWIESFGTKFLLIFDLRENISNASKSMD